RWSRAAQLRYNRAGVRASRSFQAYSTDAQQSTSGSWSELTDAQRTEIYRTTVLKFNPRLSMPDADAIARSILFYSNLYDLDPRLILALVLVESNFRIDATIRHGAMGLAQLMPGTAAGLGVGNAYDPVANLKGCMMYLRAQINRQSGGARW